MPGVELRETILNEIANGATPKECSEKYNISAGTIRSWVSRAKAKGEMQPQRNAAKKEKVATKKAATQRKSATKKSKITRPKESIFKLEDVDEELTEKQRLFCLYYIKNFNATQAAIKAGYSPDSAHVEGCRLLKKAKVAKEIRRLKGTIQEEIFIGAMDVLNKYIKIAFADVNDYLSFGQREVQCMGPFGPIYEGEGEDKKPVTKIVNYVDLKDSNLVDGTIISEVSQTRDGVKIKTIDKTKALEKLEKYFDLFPDKFKRQIEEEKLKLAQRKAGDEDDTETPDDGFIDALNAEAPSVWSDENED